MKTIAIIGGGPAAIAVLHKLQQKFLNYNFIRDVEIIVYEKNGNIGPGLPYSPSEDCYILNIPIADMRVDLKNKNGFINWLSINFSCIHTQFPSRKYFGFYLAYLSFYLKEKFKQNSISLKYFVNSEVIDISRTLDNQYKIKTDRNIKTVNYVVLCTGHMPSTLYQNLKPYPGYRHSQWVEGAFNDISANQDVGVIGSRLSAIDVAMKLREQKHQGRIIMFSRSGLLPAVLGKHVPHYTLKYLTVNNISNILAKKRLRNLPLNDLLCLFWKEISEAEGKNITFNWLHKSFMDVSPIEWINREIKQAETGKRPWQQVMFAIYSFVPYIWRQLSFKDKKQFMRDYYSLYMTYLAAFPLDNAYKIQEMLLTGQLVVVGGLKTISYQKGTFIVETNKETYLCKTLFNATGPGYDPVVCPLYRQMSKKGIVAKHHFGGICVDPKTLQVFDYKKNKQPHLYALGELTRGACLATTDMSQLTRQANQVATHLALSVQKLNNRADNSKAIVNPHTHEEQSYNRQLNVLGLFHQRIPGIVSVGCLIGCAVGTYVAVNYLYPKMNKC